MKPNKGFLEAAERGNFVGSIRYKIDVLEALKAAGWSTYRILTAPVEQRPFGQSTVTKLRHGGGISFSNLATVCELLHCQPGDILEYVPDEDERQPGHHQDTADA